MKKFHTRKGGFTLIELMIVVAIIGILAAIAIPNFLRFQLKAKTSEGKTNLAAIRTAEESYYAEFGIYVSANASPAEPGLHQKIAFDNVDGDNFGFDRLGWLPEGQVPDCIRCDSPTRKGSLRLGQFALRLRGRSASECVRTIIKRDCESTPMTFHSNLADMRRQGTFFAARPRIPNSDTGT